MKERTYTAIIFIIGLVIMIFIPYFTGDVFYFILGVLTCLLSIIHWSAIKDKLKEVK